MQHTRAFLIPNVPGTQHLRGPLVQKLDSHSELLEQLANSGSPPDADWAAVGATIEEITGKAIIEANPIFLIASRLDKPAKDDW